MIAPTYKKFCNELKEAIKVSSIGVSSAPDLADHEAYVIMELVRRVRRIAQYYEDSVGEPRYEGTGRSKNVTKDAKRYGTDIIEVDRENEKNET